MGGADRIVFLIYFNFLLIKFGLNDLVQTTVVIIPPWCATLIPINLKIVQGSSSPCTQLNAPGNLKISSYGRN